MADISSVVPSRGGTISSFYFDLVDTRTAQQGDTDSFSCSFDDAEALAQNLAARIGGMEPEFLAGYSILVTNRDGAEIVRVALTGAKRLGRTSHDLV
jgi:hypothetical protein